MRTRCLEFHARYRCRHSGECCRAPWDIEVEPQVVAEVQLGRIVPLHRGVEPFRTDPGGAVTLARTPDGDCHFHDAARCNLQAAGGERMLPSACRHFPRVLLLDARGCLLTLSHYCPTAAALLLDGSGTAIVDADPPLALSEPLEGLDARHALPPLLRPGMLMDVESYGHFEAACVTAFTRAVDASAALDRVARAVETIRQWGPGGESLAGWIDAAFRAAQPGQRRVPLSAGFDLAASLIGPHPWIEVPADFSARWMEVCARGGPWLQGVIGRYLAAATFGNWMAYRGQGLRTVVHWLVACCDVLRLQIVRETGDARVPSRAAIIEAVRAADYLVVHTVDSLAFGRAAARIEHATSAP